uniref:Uncharacterized protein n=1 Tax=Trichogramma kaykai TaxID=54128 RepID=A0ABD2XKF1_9HYME
MVNGSNAMRTSTRRALAAAAVALYRLALDGGSGSGSGLCSMLYIYSVRREKLSCHEQIRVLVLETIFLSWCFAALHTHTHTHTATHACRRIRTPVTEHPCARSSAWITTSRTKLYVYIIAHRGTALYTFGRLSWVQHQHHRTRRKFATSVHIVRVYVRRRPPSSRETARDIRPVRDHQRSRITPYYCRRARARPIKHKRCARDRSKLHQTRISIGGCVHINYKRWSSPKTNSALYIFVENYVTINQASHAAATAMDDGYFTSLGNELVPRSAAHKTGHLTVALIDAIYAPCTARTRVYKRVSSSSPQQQQQQTLLLLCIIYAKQDTWLSPRRLGFDSRYRNFLLMKFSIFTFKNLYDSSSENHFYRFLSQGLSTCAEVTICNLRQAARILRREAVARATGRMQVTRSWIHRERGTRRGQRRGAAAPNDDDDDDKGTF